MVAEEKEEEEEMKEQMKAETEEGEEVAILGMQGRVQKWVTNVMVTDGLVTEKRSNGRDTPMKERDSISNSAATTISTEGTIKISIIINSSHIINHIIIISSSHRIINHTINTSRIQIVVTNESSLMTPLATFNNISNNISNSVINHNNSIFIIRSIILIISSNHIIILNNSNIISNNIISRRRNRENSILPPATPPQPIRARSPPQPIRAG